MASSESDSDADSSRDGDRGSTVRTPGGAGRRGKDKSRTPQERIDTFWDKFMTKTPGRVTAIIPPDELANKTARRSKPRSTGHKCHTVLTSFEEAVAICKAKVAQIVKECRRVNQKYRDPHFDLELDLKLCRRDCLDSLDNRKDKGKKKEPDNRDKGRRVPSVDLRGMEQKDPFRVRDEDETFQPRSVKRVVDIFDSPEFYVDGPTANDVRQGRDGDCWLMAALCTMSNKSGLIERICVAHDTAVGVYGFVFHRDGDWFSEIIDDKLYLTKPDYDEGFLERILWEDRERVNSEETYRKTYQSNSGALYFAQCENPNETWLPLLEKAYAKAHGDYSAIEGGFTGEGLEDLTGGVTSEIYTTDILDKEYFWKEELLRVNQNFLFGCSTGVWGRGWGERKGIVELHAYSVMRAVEIDGVRLVLLKNPWGKGEWTGPWSDGSKEWTAEWLHKLDWRFGDDGAFWISYQELLRKYQAFDRTRLFDSHEWNVAAVWASFPVPWATTTASLGYSRTKFRMELKRAGPVVVVLAQLDERYFVGLEGQYRFELSFRLHKYAGLGGEHDDDDDDYIIRGRTGYRMNRSANVELDLEVGEYTVLVKIEGQRNDDVMPPEEVVRANARDRREKLLRVGLAYDLSHAKAKFTGEEEEGVKAMKDAYKQRMKVKEREKAREDILSRRREEKYLDLMDLRRKKRRVEKARAKKEAKKVKKKSKAQAGAKKAEMEKPEPAEAGKKTSQDISPPASDGQLGPVSKSEERAATTDYQAADESKNEAPATEGDEPKKRPASDVTVPTSIMITTSNGQEIKEEPETEAPGKRHIAAATTVELQGEKQKPVAAELVSSGTKSQAVAEDNITARKANVVDRGVQVPEVISPAQSACHHVHHHHHHHHHHHSPASPQELSTFSPCFHSSGMPPPPPPPLSGTISRAATTPVRHVVPDSSSSSSSDSDVSDLGDISSVSELTDRELDMHIENCRRIKAAQVPAATPAPTPAIPPPAGSDDDEDGNDPWNAVAIIGLRVYYKVSAEEKEKGEDKDVVRLKVVRPNRYALLVDGDAAGGDGPGDKVDGENVLDVDDSAKDATLEGVTAEGGEATALEREAHKELEKDVEGPEVEKST